MVASITIVGLGPGQWSDLTLEAYRVLAQAAAGSGRFTFAR